ADDRRSSAEVTVAIAPDVERTRPERVARKYAGLLVCAERVEVGIACFGQGGADGVSIERDGLDLRLSGHARDLDRRLGELRADRMSGRRHRERGDKRSDEHEPGHGDSSETGPGRRPMGGFRGRGADLWSALRVSPDNNAVSITKIYGSKWASRLRFPETSLD